MKKETLLEIILGTIGGLIFAIGMCMGLIPEWDMLNVGIIVGYYGFWVMFENVDITKVSIRKEFQGMKLSNILMEDCINRVKLLECEKINLEVRVDNFRAINLYKKYGFKEVIVRKDYYGKNEDALILCKEL